eukprot:CAMPEP_0173324234 /NCGR_PEP_ID=MMETSP1143-20121109/30944_1 /TAXON_ID=483371 /ORGANISM="non described non described, Strain CCMP2298" /LENGTH=289 /DNA_ID=CAMNT_0014268257 /DNA_START=116 /DNA_END=986 /DNA_ORIENTATION=-
MSALDAGKLRSIAAKRSRKKGVGDRHSEACVVLRLDHCDQHGRGGAAVLRVHGAGQFWMGVSNAIAGGMMVAASYSLVSEGANFQAENFEMLASIANVDAALQPSVNTGLGFFMGILFILATKYLLSSVDHDILDIDASSQKMVLIVFVMTLHSLTEGIGIGVSFGGISGMQLGQFISFSLAVHNVPEGLAVGLVLTTRKVDKLRAVLWAIFTSLPQPIFAIPAFLFVERFATLLPLGLGFAAGAMAYVAVFELLSEAAEETGLVNTGLVGVVSCVVMAAIQEAVKLSI